jgi:hypothetical protein
MKTNQSIMNQTICKIVLILAAPLAVTAWAAEPALPTTGVAHEERSELVKHAPMHELTFLGLVTRNADEVVAAQLELSPETGLVVVEVVPDGPAAGVLKVNDLLVRFDDQVLIEPRQLGVLVRSHKEGDEVKLTYYRGGKQQTARVKLAKHMVPEAAMTLPRNHNKFFAHSGGEPFGASTLAFREGRPGEMRISKIERNGSSMVFEDGKGRLEVSNKDGKKFLTARNDKNDVIFSGPVDTPEQRKAMPQEVRERLEKMESTDVRMPVPPVPPVPPLPPGTGAGVHRSSTPIHGSGEMPDRVDVFFGDDGVS